MRVTDRRKTLTSIWDLLLPDGNRQASIQADASGSSKNAFKLGSDLAYKILKNGITSKAVNPVGEFVGLNKALIANYVGLNRGTVSRLASKGQPLPTHSAEKLLRLLELDGQARENFSSEEEAFAWLNRSHPMLDGDTPRAAAKTSYGAQRVTDILLALQYGGVV